MFKDFFIKIINTVISHWLHWLENCHCTLIKKTQFDEASDKIHVVNNTKKKRADNVNFYEFIFDFFYYLCESIVACLRHLWAFVHIKNLLKNPPANSSLHEIFKRSKIWKNKSRTRLKIFEEFFIKFLRTKI